MNPANLEPPFQLTVRTEQLRQHRREATLLLRLGAVANALLSVGRAFRAADKSLAQIRDQVHYTALIASFAVEAGRIVNETSDNLTWQLAEAGLGTGPSSAVRPQINHLRMVLTKGSRFLETCAFVRDQHTFHIDAKPVLRWLSSRPVNDAIILQTVEGAQFTSCLFDASARAVRAGLPSVTQQPDFTESLVRFAAALPLLVHSMTRGFGLLTGAKLVVQKPPEKPPYEINLRPLAGAYSVVVEIRPVGTSWSRFYVGLPSDQAEKVRPQLRAGGRDADSPTRAVGLPPKRDYPGWWICLSSEALTADGDSYYLYCIERPTVIIFGQVGGEQHRALLLEEWGPRKISGLPQAPIVQG